jgi:multiple sugar transport system ATP-binding protein
MATVTLTNVQKVYADGSKAVRDFNLEIADGEFIVLVGPSGCGKSTTLRMVAGLEEVSGGQIAIDGRVVNEVHPKDRDIAMVFQNYALYPHMSVYENIAFSLRLRSMEKGEIDARVKRASALLGLDAMLSKRPSALSGGQRQRVAVGRAIVREPKAFLFDEPLSNLDARLRVTTRAEIKSLQMRLKTTTIYVTHDQEEAMTMGDRVVVMYGGVVQQAGTPLEVYRRPVNRFVAGFLGTPPMNFLNGTVERAGGGLEFVESGAGGDRGGGVGGAGGASGAVGARVALPGAWQERLAGVVGRAAVLGVRPQSLTEEGGSGGGAIEVVVDLVELLGDAMDISGRTALGNRVVARVPPREGVVAGARVRLRADLSHGAVFEPGEVGRSLTVGA